MFKSSRQKPGSSGQTKGDIWQRFEIKRLNHVEYVQPPIRQERRVLPSLWTAKLATQKDKKASSF